MGNAGPRSDQALESCSHSSPVWPHLLRRMIDLTKQVKQPHHHLRLSADFRSDLHWWATFLPKWNGKSMIHQPDPAHSITANASGSWGCGAFGSNGAWFQVQWPESWARYHIASKEMVPVVIAVALWGAAWQSSSVLVCSDNIAVVCAISSGAAKDPLLMHLLRCLHYFLAQFDVSLVAKHIAGVHNTAADALSRNKLVSFFQCVPQANQLPTPVPLPLMEMLLHRRPDWLSTAWGTMFLTTLDRHLAPSTMQVYRSGLKRFTRFCNDAKFTSLPLTENLLCMFVAHLV